MRNGLKQYLEEMHVWGKDSPTKIQYKYIRIKAYIFWNTVYYMG